MRVLKGIVLLRTGAEISQSSSESRIPAAGDAARKPEIDFSQDELSLDHWTSAQRRTREHSSPGSPADADCEDWT